MRRNFEKNGDMDIYQRIIADNAALFGAVQATTNNDDHNEMKSANDCLISSFISPESVVPVPPCYNTSDNQNEVIILDTPTDGDLKSIPDQEQQVTSTDELTYPTSTINDKTTEWLNSTQFEIENNSTNDSSSLFKIEDTTDDDKTLNELLEQVAELDEIYTDHQLRRENNAFIENELKNMECSMAKGGVGDDDKMDIDEIFDDAATYTSLQRAFKNPVEMEDLVPIAMPSIDSYNHNFSNNNNFTYDLVEPPVIVNPPIIDVSPLKRDIKRDEEKLPPLPPKRVKKQPGSPENNENRQPPPEYVPNDNEINISRHGSTRSTTPRPMSQPIIIMKTPDSPLNKKLPAKPNNSNTLPKQKKPGFFSKLFSRKKSKGDLTTGSAHTSNRTTPLISREPSLNNLEPTRGSFSSLKTFQTQNNIISPSNGKTTKTGKPVGRSVSSVSGKRPHLTPDVIHIPLKGDSTNSIPQRSESGTHLSLHDGYDRSNNGISLHPNRTVSALQLADLPLQEGNMELIAIADARSLKDLQNYGVHLDPSIDLTEAEHYALYTAVPPNATMSEFDENSCYYAPVEAGEILTPAEVAKRLTNNL